MKKGRPKKIKGLSPIEDTGSNTMTETPVLEIFSDYI
jgi:hypothetical protein